MKYLNFGSCNIDYVYSLDHIVKGGETLSSGSLNIFPGGKGLNQSIALARAGAKVYHAGCLGVDGELLLKTLSENGVDTSYLRTVDEKNGHAIIQVSRDGENSIFLFAGSNEMITREHVDSVLSDFSEGDILLLQNEINDVDYIIDKASERGMFIILNPSPIKENILALDLSKLSCLILNEGEICDITGAADTDSAEDLLAEKYPELRIMLTLGKNGCVYRYKDERVYHPIFEVRAVDTTAAGDTFTGYFAKGLGETDDMRMILRTASCAAAISVSRHGAAPSIPVRSEVTSLLDSMKIKETDRSKMRQSKIISAFIDRNLSSITLEALANHLGYSSVYTGSLVKRIFGVPFTRLVLDKKLEVAEGLLSGTDTPVGEIIKSLGYENENYFRDKFKEKYKKKPLEYRKKENGK